MTHAIERVCKNDAYHVRDCSVGSEVPPSWNIQVDSTRRKLDVSETSVHARELVLDETKSPLFLCLRA